MKSIGFIFVAFVLALNLARALDTRFCKCRTQTSKRVINGRHTTLNEYPWQISLQIRDTVMIPDSRRKLLPEDYKIARHTCGGSIINDYWVLTAAHCISDQNSDVRMTDLRIGYGDNDLVRMYDDKKQRKISKIIVHPQYSRSEGIVYDIALIRVDEPFVFNRNTQPACLADQTVDIYSGALQITGWGAINAMKGYRYEMEDPIISRFLKVGDTYDQSNTMSICEKVKYQNICVDNNRTKEAACNGDSGGPLHHTKNGKTSVIGLVSWGPYEKIGPALYQICTGPDAYTRVSYFNKWIRKNAGEICT